MLFVWAQAFAELIWIFGQKNEKMQRNTLAVRGRERARVSRAAVGLTTTRPIWTFDHYTSDHHTVTQAGLSLGCLTPAMTNGRVMDDCCGIY